MNVPIVKLDFEIKEKFVQCITSEKWAYGIIKFLEIKEKNRSICTYH